MQIERLHAQPSYATLVLPQMANIAFRKLALLGEELERTTSRLELARLMADFLQGLKREEIAPAVRLTIGQVFPEWDGRALNLSWAAVFKVMDDLTQVTEEQRQAITAEAVDGGEAVMLLLERARKRPSQGPALSLLEVYHIFEQIAETAGRGSRKKKEDLLRSLLARAEPLEAKYIVKDVLGEMRHGVSEGMMLEAIALAAGAEKEAVRRANMICGDLGAVAEIALREGDEGLKGVAVRIGRPLKPMLAQTAEDMAEAFEYHEGRIALEYKLDGARVQIHKDGDRVRIFSRRLSDVTGSLPDVVEAVRQNVHAGTAIIEGEAIAVDAEGRPLPFQHVMQRFRRVHNVQEMVKEIPVELYLFDILYRDGQSFIDVPSFKRWEALEEVAGHIPLVRRVVPGTAEEGEAFAQEAYEAGHEGVMVKHLESRYTPGVRGKSWFKIKHALSLDLVIVAADWGYGRRHGWLSNYHLAARDEETGEYLEVGKTFKGLTDDEFQEMTERLLSIKRRQKGPTVFVEPKVVVEVLFNEIQRSSQYESGLALRFARIARLREDKSPHDADTIQTMREIFKKQFEYKGRA